MDSDPACIHVLDSKSDAGVRTVWLTKHCKDTLASWRRLLGPDFSEFVFPSPKISGTFVSEYKTSWRTAAKKAGLADRRIYDLRATFASRANACKASGMTVAQLLGHASTQILPAYVRPLDENTKGCSRRRTRLVQHEPIARAIKTSPPGRHSPKSEVGERYRDIFASHCEPVWFFCPC